jgi:hypothetical protein
MIEGVGRALLRITETAPAVDPSAGRGPEWGKAAPIGLLVIVLMGLAVALLLRSMNKQLKKVPKSFDSAEPAADLGPTRTDDGGTQPPVGPDVPDNSRPAGAT